MLHNKYASIFLFSGAPSSMKRRNAPPEKRKANVINIFLVQCWRDQYHTPEEVPLIRGLHGSSDMDLIAQWCRMVSPSLFQRRRFLEQTNTLVKTLMFFSSRPLSFYILTNDDTVFVDIRNAAAQYNSSQLARCGLSSDLFLFRCFKVRIQVLFSGGYLSPRLGRDDWRLQVLCYGSSFLTSMHISCMYVLEIIAGSFSDSC